MTIASNLIAAARVIETMEVSQMLVQAIDKQEIAWSKLNKQVSPKSEEEDLMGRFELIDMLYREYREKLEQLGVATFKEEDEK